MGRTIRGACVVLGGWLLAACGGEAPSGDAGAGDVAAGSDAVDDGGADAGGDGGAADGGRDAADDGAGGNDGADSAADAAADADLGALPEAFAPFGSGTLLVVPLYHVDAGPLPDVLGVQLRAVDEGAVLRFVDGDEAPVLDQIRLSVAGEELVASGVPYFGDGVVDLVVAVREGAGGPELSIRVPVAFEEANEAVRQAWLELWADDEKAPVMSEVSRTIRLQIVERYRALQDDPSKCGLEWMADTYQYVFDVYADASYRLGLAQLPEEELRIMILEDLLDVFVDNSARSIKDYASTYFRPSLEGGELVGSESAAALTGYASQLTVGEGRYRHFILNALTRSKDPTLGQATDLLARLNGNDWGNVSGDSLADVLTNEAGRDFYAFIAGVSIQDLGDGRTVRDWLIERLAQDGEVPPTRRVSVTRDGNGSGTVIGVHSGAGSDSAFARTIDCGGRCVRTVSSVWDVTLSAVPDAGSTFAGWSGDCSGAEACELILRNPGASREVTATFERALGGVTVLKVGPGSGVVTGEPPLDTCDETCGARRFETNDGFALTATASPGSEFLGFTGGGCSGTGPCSPVVSDDDPYVYATFHTEPLYAALDLLLEPEGMQVIRAPERLGFELTRPSDDKDVDAARCPPVLVATGGGSTLLDPCSGDVFRQHDWFTEPGERAYDAVMLGPPGGELGSTLYVLAGTGGRRFLLDRFGMFGNFSSILFGTFSDTQVQDDALDPVVVMARRTNDLLVYRWVRDPDNPWGDTGSYEQSTWTFDTFQIESAVMSPDRSRLLTIGAEGLVAYDVTGDTPTRLTQLDLGTQPRRIRCDGERSICAVSDFADSTITLVAWDGGSAPVITDTVAVADGPVGIDIREGYVVSAGYNDNQLSTIRLADDGTADAVVTEALHEGCEQPGHAALLGEPAGAVMITCFGSGGYVYAGLVR